MLDAADFNVTLCTEAGNCHVDDARNSLVREFLKTDATDMVFVDADVGFRPEDLLRLVSVDRDVVAGIYPKKEDDESFPVIPLPGEIWADADGLVEVEGVPTGFLRIRRHVLETLRANATSFIGQNGEDEPYHLIFERMIAGNRRMSGDYAFCHKWRKTGGRIFVDPEMVFTHTGAKSWTGSLGGWWKRKHGVETQLAAEKFDRAMKAIIAGNPTALDFADLAEGWANGWSASPELLAHAWKLAKGNILECGSGLTTLVMACKGHVTALEHDPMFASHTAAMLDRYGLKADIICKPLKDGWYDFDGGIFDTLMIDGPPRAKADRAEAIRRVKAKLVIWDDYETGLENPEIIEGANRFAILSEAA